MFRRMLEFYIRCNHRKSGRRLPILQLKYLKLTNYVQKILKVDHVDQSFKDLILSIKHARDISTEDKLSIESHVDDDSERQQPYINRRRAHSFQDIFNRKSGKKKQQRQSSLERSR